MAAFDVDGRGEIDYEAFERFAWDQPGVKAHMSVEDKLRALIKKAQGQGIDVYESFQHFDKDEDGVIERAELRVGLGQLRFECSERELAFLFQKLDPEEKGLIDMDQVREKERERERGGMLESDSQRESEIDGDRERARACEKDIAPNGCAGLPGVPGLPCICCTSALLHSMS